MDPWILRQKTKDKFKYTTLALQEYYDKGAITINPTSLTSWNWPDQTGATKEGPPYDVEGHGSADVCAELRIPYYKKEFWNLIPREIGDYFKYLNEFVVEGFTKRPLSRTAENLKTWGWEHRPFINPTERWLWVIDSVKDSVKIHAYQMAEDRRARKEGYEDSLDMFAKTKKIYDHKSIQIAADAIPKDEVFADLLASQEYVQISKNLYVSLTDPTCMIYDEGYLPFAYKDGWSPNQLAHIISVWYKHFYGVSPEVKPTMRLYV